jgi:hypothetical protein
MFAALLEHVWMVVAVMFLWAVLRNLEGIGQHITKLAEIHVQAVSVADTHWSALEVAVQVLHEIGPEAAMFTWKLELRMTYSIWTVRLSNKGSMVA